MRRKNNKISLFISNMKIGCAQKVALVLANEISERGHKVDLVILNGRGEYLNYLVDGVTLINLNSDRAYKALPKLISYLRDQKPIVMLSFMEIDNILSIIARMLSFINVRVIINIHALLSQEKRHSNNSNYKISITLSRYLYPFAHGIIGVSQGVVEDLVNRFGISRHRCKTIYNPIGSIHEKSYQINSLLSLGKHSFRPLILSVGTLKKSKHFQNLIRGFNLVRLERDCQLAILGEGDERTNLEELIRELDLQNDVLLPGSVDDSFPYMERATVFVLSSIWESFGLVLVEAMSAGTPVVSTDCPTGPSEILKDGLYGELVPVGNPKRLAKAIIKTFDDPIDSKILVKRAKDFSTEKIIPQYISYIGKVCN